MVTSNTSSLTGAATADASVQAPAGRMQQLMRRWGLPFHSVSYFAAVAATFLLTFGQNLYAARALGPAVYGIWNIFAITLTYNLLVHGGALNGLAREFPRAVADGNQHEVHDLAESAFWINALGSLLFAVVATLSLRAAFSSVPQITWRVLLVFAVFLLLQGWTNFLMFVYRARDQFTRLSHFIVVVNAAVLAGAFLFIPRWKLEGFVIAYAAAYFLASVLYFRTAPRGLLALPNWSAGWRLLRIGAPILLFTLTATINWTMDRLLIARFLTLTAVGYFAVASFAVRLLTSVPEMISQVMYPHWAVAKLSRQGAGAELSSGPFRVVFWAMPVMCGVSYYACFLIPVFLPKYTESVLPSQVLCLAASLMGVGLFCGAYLGASGREKSAFQAQVVMLVLRVIVVGGALLLGSTLLGVAYASGFSGTVFGIAVLWTAARQFRARWKFLLNGMAPSLLCTGWLLLVELLRRHLAWHAPANAEISGAMLLFLLGSLAMLILLRGRTMSLAPRPEAQPLR